MKHEYVSVSNVTNYLDTFFTFIIPVVLIIFMNVVIAKVVFRSHNMGLQDAERSSCDGVRFHPVGSQVRGFSNLVKCIIARLVGFRAATPPEILIRTARRP